MRVNQAELPAILSKQYDALMKHPDLNCNYTQNTQSLFIQNLCLPIVVKMSKTKAKGEFHFGPNLYSTAAQITIDPVSSKNTSDIESIENTLNQYFDSLVVLKWSELDRPLMRFDKVEIVRTKSS